MDFKKILAWGVLVVICVVVPTVSIYILGGYKPALFVFLLISLICGVCWSIWYLVEGHNAKR